MSTALLLQRPAADEAAATVMGRHRHRHRQPGRVAPRLDLSTLVTPGWVTTLVLAAIAGFRTAVIASSGSPSGVDFGNWLMLGHQWLGHTLPDSSGVTYPPLVPVLAVWTSHLVGVLWADALLAGVAGIAPALGLYVAARLCGARWAAVPAAALLAATSSTGEAVAWGGLPQLIGFGFALAAVGAAVQAVRSGTLRSAALLGALLFGVALVSHLVMAQAVLAVVLVLALRIIAERPSLRRASWLGRSGWLARAGVSIAPLLILIPLYLRLLATVGQSFVSSNQVSAGLPALRVFIDNLTVVRRDAPWVWGAALILTVAVPVVFARRCYRQRLWSITVALTVATILPVLFSGEARLAYFAPLAVCSALIFALTQLARSRSTVRYRNLAIVALVLIVAWTGERGLTFFPDQRSYYGAFVPAGSISALNWLESNTPETALVAVAPIDGAPFGWWVQGVGRRSALVGSEDQWLNFPTERTGAQQAVALFTASDPLGPDVMARARQLHVQYLVIPWLWGGLASAQLDAFRAANPATPVFANRALVIVAVPTAP